MIEEIKLAIKNNIKIEHIEIIDQSNQHEGHTGNAGGGHYKAIIISNDFTGKTLIQRHRMVYDSLGDMMQNEIHAFSMKTLTASEFNNQ